jgi:hypothetical protein
MVKPTTESTRRNRRNGRRRRVRVYRIDTQTVNFLVKCGYLDKQVIIRFNHIYLLLEQDRHLSRPMPLTLVQRYVIDKIEPVHNAFVDKAPTGGCV